MKWLLVFIKGTPWMPKFICPACKREVENQDIANCKCSHCGVEVENTWERYTEGDE